MCHCPNFPGCHCTYVSIWQASDYINFNLQMCTRILLCVTDPYKSYCSIHWSFEKIWRPCSVKDRLATCHSHHKGAGWQMYRQQVRWSYKYLVIMLNAHYVHCLGQALLLNSPCHCIREYTRDGATSINQTVLIWHLSNKSYTIQSFFKNSDLETNAYQNKQWLKRQQ